MATFLSGALSATSVIAAVFFWRFWRLSGDRLFVYFALGFGVLAVHWAAVGLLTPAIETRHELYAIRLAAFLLIITGIVEKNVRPRG
jgi:hypothetical protein